MTATKKRKIVYRETYRRGAARLTRDRLPTLRHLPDGCDFDVIETELLCAGSYDDGTEFQELRVIIGPRVRSGR